MAIRQRTQRSVGQRHDREYFKKLSPIRAWQWRLAAIAIGLALIWMAVSSMRRGSTMFSKGPMSSAHAVIGQQCETCHKPVIAGAGWLPIVGARRHVADSACLSCHVAPAHHPMEVTSTPSCGSCHVEHQGSMHLAAAADKSCTQCHADLRTRSGQLDVASGIHSFVNGHPDFRPLRIVSETDKATASGLKFDHAAHLQKGLLGPKGSTTLQCADCHRSAAQSVAANWRFAGQPDPVTDGTQSSTLLHTAAFQPAISTDRAYMAPATYQQTCRACHTLEFDSHIGSEAPHKDVATVHRFVVQQLTNYAATHPQVVAQEIRNWQVPRNLPERMSLPAPHNSQEWVQDRIKIAEVILWREKCNLCHTVSAAEPAASEDAHLVQASLSTSAEPGKANPGAANLAKITGTMAAPGLPAIAPAQQPQRFFSAAMFSHQAHQAVTCTECHVNASSSQTGKDLLMPGIQTCQRCHNGESHPQGPPVSSGHAESGCFLCHYYHGDVAHAAAGFTEQHPGFTVSELTGRK